MLARSKAWSCNWLWRRSSNTWSCFLIETGKHGHLLDYLLTHLIDDHALGTLMHLSPGVSTMSRSLGCIGVWQQVAWFHHASNTLLPSRQHLCAQIKVHCDRHVTFRHHPDENPNATRLSKPSLGVPASRILFILGLSSYTGIVEVVILFHVLR
jgi:hypothetical protein